MFFHPKKSFDCEDTKNSDKARVPFQRSLAKPKVFFRTYRTPNNFFICAFYHTGTPPERNILEQCIHVGKCSPVGDLVW